MIRAAFLDRDGVINIDRAYVHRIEDFELIDGVLEAALRLKQAGYLLVVVTNQSGIARGMFTEEQFALLNDHMKRLFAQAGAPIDAVYFCPHHAEKGVGRYKIACDCRKPLPGLILRAAKELGISLENSMIFGDKPRDLQAGLNAGIPIRVHVGQDGKERPKLTAPATHTGTNLLRALSSENPRLLISLS